MEIVSRRRDSVAVGSREVGMGVVRFRLLGETENVDRVEREIVVEVV